ILHEIVRWRRWTATAVGFCGVLVMVRPGHAAIDPATFVALGESVALALLIVIVKLMPPREKTLAMLFWFGAIATPITLLPAIYVWVWPTLGDWLWLIGMALAGVGSQWFFLLAFRSGEASFVAPIDYTRLIFVAAVGYLAFSEIPSPWTLLGAAIIVGSTLYIVRREAQLGRRAVADDAPPAS